MANPNFDSGAGEHPRAEDFAFDLDRALSSVVALRARIPQDALTAPLLGTERAGHGVLIGEDGLVVTIGYLVTEAEEVWLINDDGLAVPGHVVGYDQETGFGLVQALQSLRRPVLAVGSSADLLEGERVILAGQGGREHAVNARVIAKREFAGYWEYLLEEAIFTAPSHPNWGGTALIGADGKLRGIGSLFVQQVAPEETPGGNMVVPIDLLKPVLGDLVRFGQTNKAPRPWLGMLTTEAGRHLVVAGVIDGSPAQQADVQVGDVVLEVNGRQVHDLADMFRRIWSLGQAGVQVPLTVFRDGGMLEVSVRSVNRSDCLKTPHYH